MILGIRARNAAVAKVCMQLMHHLVLNSQLSRYGGADLEDFNKITPKAVVRLNSLDVDI